MYVRVFKHICVGGDGLHFVPSRLLCEIDSVIREREKEREGDRGSETVKKMKRERERKGAV